MRNEKSFSLNGDHREEIFLRLLKYIFSIIYNEKYSFIISHI